MARLKPIMVLIAECLMGLRNDPEIETFPFVFVFTDENKALDIYVERDDGTYRDHITSTQEFVKYMDDSPSIEEFALNGLQYIEQNTRRVHKVEPGECVGCGSLITSDFTAEDDIRDVIMDALKWYLCPRK